MARTTQQKLEVRRAWYARNRAKIREQKRAAYALNQNREICRSKDWKAANRDHVLAYARSRYHQDVERSRERRRQHYALNSEACRARQAAYVRVDPGRARDINARSYRRRREDVAFVLSKRVAAAVRHCLKGGKLGRSSGAIVGWSAAELRAHLERQFLPGMTWSNMGEWHIDHIVPLASFAIAGPDCPELKRAWALTNLRPLWAADNIKKRDHRDFLI